MLALAAFSSCSKDKDNDPQYTNSFTYDGQTHAIVTDRNDDNFSSLEGVHAVWGDHNEYYFHIDFTYNNGNDYICLWFMIDASQDGKVFTMAEGDTEWYVELDLSDSFYFEGNDEDMLDIKSGNIYAKKTSETSYDLVVNAVFSNNKTFTINYSGEMGDNIGF